jgi:hypothetical protein
MSDGLTLSHFSASARGAIRSIALLTCLAIDMAMQCEDRDNRSHAHSVLGAARVICREVPLHDFAPTNTKAMKQGSSFSSIVPAHAPTWRRLRETEDLARLHAKFWRRSMEAEEREWRKTQLENEPMAVDVDECSGGDTTEDTEGDDDEIDADEIDAGCYVLQIDISGLEEIWIRKEYIKLYNCCDDHLTHGRQSMKPRSAVITGQPGIGECFTS